MRIYEVLQIMVRFRRFIKFFFCISLLQINIDIRILMKFWNWFRCRSICETNYHHSRNDTRAGQLIIDFSNFPYLNLKCNTTHVNNHPLIDSHRNRRTPEFRKNVINWISHNHYFLAKKFALPKKVDNWIWLCFYKHEWCQMSHLVSLHPKQLKLSMTKCWPIRNW